MSSKSTLVKLTTTPIKPAEIPPEKDILQSARALIESTTSWEEGKSYHKGVVKGYHHPKGPNDGAPWFCRVSIHGPEDATFQEFWDKLGHDKAENEKQFIHSIDKVTLLQRVSPTQSIWNIHYHFPPPVANRSFTVLQVTNCDDTSPKRTGLIVSIPVDVTSDTADANLAKLEQKGVKGRYVSVERLQELDDGQIEWRMATSSTPGGSIPEFIANSSTPGKVAEDVPSFLHWLKSQRKASSN